MKIQENIILKDYSTFRTGGQARYFVSVTSVDELKEAIAFAKKQNLPIFILGGGSNILISDAGFPGVVIQIAIKKYMAVHINDTEAIVTAGAGESWDAFVGKTVAEGYRGLENLSYIPGLVGAAPVQNIGAYGSEIKDTLVRVEALNMETGEIEFFSNSECMFAYRDSIFKKTEGKKYCIVSVSFLLSTDRPLNTDYKDIKDYIEKNAVTDMSVQKIRDIVIAIRKNKLPEVKEYGTAGSFFKNPIIKKTHYEELLKSYPLLPSYPTTTQDMVKVPAAWMLDNLCGFKGYRDGDVGVYKNQALVLVNFGSASAEKILLLAEKMIACVKEKTNIVLEKEVQII